MGSSGKIVVYFLDNHKVVFERDKVAFMDGEQVFTLSDAYGVDEYYAGLCRDGKAFVNWQNVCYVKEYVESTEFDDL